MMEKPTNKSKIECAKILLDEVIDHLGKEPIKIKYQKSSNDIIDEDLSPEAQAAKDDLLH
jgi:hypothetical protein